MPVLLVLLGLAVLLLSFVPLKRFVKAKKEGNREVQRRYGRRFALQMLAGIVLFFVGASMIEPVEHQATAVTDSPRAESAQPSTPPLWKRIMDGVRMVDEDDTIKAADKPLLRRAVENVLTNEPKCLQAFTAGKSKDDGRYFVNCADDAGGFNVYFTKKELEADKPLTKVQPYDEVKALQACRALLKANSQNPETYDEDVLGQDWQVFPQGYQHVTIRFSVQNGFGATFNMVGKCKVEADGKTSVLLVKPQ